MTVQNHKDMDGLKEIGKIVALTIHEMKRCARVGMTTLELDDIGGQFLKKHGAMPAPKKLTSSPEIHASALTMRLRTAYRAIESFNRAI